MKVNAEKFLLPAAILLAAAAASAPASAQQVEVVADGTQLMLDPSASSPVMATLAAGTVLEWIGESGPYYAVSVPGPPGQENLVGYVLASEVEVVGMPPSTPGDPPPGLPSGGVPIPGVAQQHAAAKGMREAGLRRAVQGAAVAATAQVSVSIAFDLEDRESYQTEAEYQAAVDRRTTAETVRNVALIGGGALVAYGIGRYVFGWRKMAELEREFPEATTPPLERQLAEATLNRTLGKRKFVWGAILAGASYLTIEYVPYFAEPAAEDFEDASEFQSALNRRGKAKTARNWIAGTGGVLGAWGLAQWILSAQKIGEIEEISRMTALSVPLERPLSESPAKLYLARVGTRTHLGVSWSW